jgi:hypothetical protein
MSPLCLWKPRCHDATNKRDRSTTNTTANIAVTVAAPVMAQQSHSRSQSNTMVGSNVPALHQSSSSNATEGKEDTTIYRRCYDCNVNLPYQVYENRSCHGPCLFCRVNKCHISCMEVHPDRTSAGGVPVRWCMWCRAYMTIAMHTNESCHGFCRYCRIRIPHDTSNIITYTTRATQTYHEDQGNYNPYERDIEAKQ